MSEFTVRQRRPLRGRIRLPGDKSISHRTLLIGALADGESTITDCASGMDVQRTAKALEELGVSIKYSGETIRITGTQLHEPPTTIDCGNSGTTMRLLMGILAGQQFSSTLVGDASLSQRPLGRVAEPLRNMGAQIDLTDDDHAPVTVHGSALAGIEYVSPVASAQVKSAVLLAGLYATGETTFIEPYISRDHTERMLSATGVKIVSSGAQTTLYPGTPRSFTVFVPGDPSSAAFFVVAATVIPGSELYCENVCINETRTGFLRVLVRMGADIEVTQTHTELGEPVGTLVVRSASLKGTRIEGSEIPALIDELPVLAVAGACADGETVVGEATELRVKESDRIATTVALLRAFRADVTESPDGFVVQGGAIEPGQFGSGGDHRLAMAGAVLAQAAGGGVIEEFEATDISFPGFADVFASLQDQP